jgi:LysR family pca operon transcriptional activator
MKRYLDQKLKLAQLRVLAAVGIQGSLLRAANLLGVSQPALTKSLREIEDVVGARLFERHARGVRPNPQGQVMIDAASSILRIIQEAEASVSRLCDQEDGQLVVGALPTAASGVMPELLLRLRRHAPSVQVKVVTEPTQQLLDALALGDLDVVVGRLYAPLRGPDNFVREVIYDEPMVVVVGPDHPLARQEVVTGEALSAYEIALPALSFRIRAETDAFLAQYGVRVAEGPSVTSLMLLRELLMSSDIVTIQPQLMLSGDLMRGTLKALKMQGPPPPSRPAGLIYRSDRPLQARAALISRMLGEYAREALAKTAP